MPIRKRTSLCSTRCDAFTLIELLAVISILAAVTAIIVPGLSRARRQSQIAVCLSNLRQLAAACTAYAGTDEKTQILPAHPVTDTDRLHHDGNYDWGGANGSSSGWGGIYSSTGNRNATSRPLNLQLFGNGGSSSSFGVFRCPSDVGPPDRWPAETWWWTPDMVDRPFFESVGTSYRGNAFRRHEWDGLYARGPFEIIGVFLRPATRVPVTAETVLLWEASGGVWRGGRYMETYRYGPQAGGRHGSPYAFTIAYVDGHAAMQSLKPKFDVGNWRTDEQGYGYQVRSGDTRWDCRPEPLLPDAPNEDSKVGIQPIDPIVAANEPMRDVTRSYCP